MTHSKFPPSAADRWLICPLTASLSLMFPDTSSAASLQGTTKHEEVANHLLTDTDSSDPKVRIYLDTVRAEPGKLYVEKKVTIVPGQCWGTSDAIVIAPNKLTVFDYKFGKSMVHATNNPQLLTYSAGTLREHPVPRDTPVELVIVQPNATTGWPVKRWTTTVDHVLAHRIKVLAAIEAAGQPDPKGVPGSHCFWCPGKLHCREYLISQGKNKS